MVQKDIHGISYTIRNRIRTKKISVGVYHDGRVMVSKPTRVSIAYIEKMMQEKFLWIQEKLGMIIKKHSVLGLRHTAKEYAQYRVQAKELAQRRLEYFNEHYQCAYKKIFIKNQKTRWGSCSSKGNLNFNYKIIFLPQSLQDYLVVHELCHLREMNHSRAFWNLVAERIPDYKKLSKQLKLGSLE